MLQTSHILPVITLALFCPAVYAQLRFQKVADFEYPSKGAVRFTGGREVEFTEDGTKMIAAFHGSTAQLFDLTKNAPIGKPIATAGDGEVGFVSNGIAYTADWNSMRLWDTKSGHQISDALPHELREDTIIHPAIDPKGKFLATRVTLKSVQLWDVATRNLVGVQKSYSTVVDAFRFSDDGGLLFVNAGGSLYAIDSGTGEDVAGPVMSGGRFSHFPKQQKLVTTEQVGEGVYQLVIRSTNQDGWPVTHRSDLPGTLKRIVTLYDNQVLVQASKEDYTPAIFTFNIGNPETRVEVKSNADRVFGLVISRDKRHWICSNIRTISCQEFGKSEPVWEMQVPPSGFDQHLYSFDNEHFIICDKQGNLGVYKVEDGSEIWKQAGVKRVSTNRSKIALCNSDGVEIWVVQ